MNTTAAETLSRLLLDEETADHARRVASSRWVTSDSQVRVALLHDVLEDTKATALDLRRMGLPRDEIDAVSALSRQEGETYMQFVKRVAGGSDTAVRVKLADLEDNLTRDPGSKLAASLRPRYQKAHGLLTREAVRRDLLPRFLAPALLEEVLS